jgi:hypothetical protein
VASAFSKANLSQADLRGANLRQSIMIKAVLDGADLTGAHVYGASVWDVILENTIQRDLVITDPFEPRLRSTTWKSLNSFIFCYETRRFGKSSTRSPRRQS